MKRKSESERKMWKENVKWKEKCNSMVFYVFDVDVDVVVDALVPI